MNIQWYPGHMNKARKQIAASMSRIDLIIEVMDARIPFSSTNPVVATLCGHRPVVKVLNKSDLANPKITKAWLNYFNQKAGIKAQDTKANDIRSARKLLGVCRGFFPERNQRIQPIRVMVLGVPNTGKSTLVNTLKGKVIATVRDEPAVTKHQQQINLGNGIFLNDTPGILWPRFEHPKNGFHLAITGAIKETAADPEEVALYAATLLLELHSEAVMRRYKIKTLPRQASALLEMVGRKRGCLKPGGVIDLHHAAQVLLHDLRSGALGRISLEAPDKYDV